MVDWNTSGQISIYQNLSILVYCIVMSAATGLVFGSFLNCGAARTVKGESFLRGRSTCPACSHTLGAADLVPLLSWAFLRGRCRYCGAKISVRYPITELAFSLLTVLCLLRFDLTVLCLRNWVFLCCLFYLTLTDLDSFLIPDGCLLAAAAAWFLALAADFPGWRETCLHILAALAYGGGTLALSLAMDHILEKETLGGGDIKLLAVCGLYLGLVGGMFTILFSCVLGLAFGVLTGQGRGKPFPFGPAISAATVGMLFWGGGLIKWYVGLL